MTKRDLLEIAFYSFAAVTFTLLLLFIVSLFIFCMHAGNGFLIGYEDGMIRCTGILFVLSFFLFLVLYIINNNSI